MKKTFLLLFLTIALSVFSACDNDKIEPGFSNAIESKNLFEPEKTIQVETREITQMYEAVGTIRPLTESVIESQVSAQVVKVNCVSGTYVKKGQLLIELDARSLKAKLKQAQEGLSLAKNRVKQADKSIDEAKANLDQARAAFERTEKLFKSDIVPSQKFEIDNAAFLQAKARLENSNEAKQAAKASVRQAQEIVEEARVGFNYSRITSPADGIVVQRMIDPGDLSVPGKPLLIIQTSGALRLEANVREGLISRVIIGKKYDVKIKTIEKTIESRIEEIVPYADPATRTFQVKALLPNTSGVYPGMFGRLLIPVKKDKTLLIPQKAVRVVGQLELVYVKKKDGWLLVYIKTGKKIGHKFEVLAGLAGNDIIGYK